MSKNLAEKLVEDMFEEDLSVNVDPSHPIFQYVIGEIAHLVIPIGKYLNELGGDVSLEDCLKIQMILGKIVSTKSAVELNELIVNKFNREDKDEKNNVLNFSSNIKCKLFQ